MDLRELSIFVKVAELRSFVRAAREIGISQSGVSNAIQRLETRTGVVLLFRTTRRVKLTEAGEAFFDHCRQILADLQEAELALNSARLQPSGRLRLSLPVSFGRFKVVPLLGAFQALYPDIKLHVGITDRLVDLVEEGIDLAIRFGALRDSSLIARHLTNVQRRVVGTPGYFALHGKPQAPIDLVSHNCIALTYHETRQIRDWHFLRDGVAGTFIPKGSMTISDGTALSAAVLAGYGIGQLHDYYIDDAICNGSLEVVLDEFRPSFDAISLVYVPTRDLSPKLRVFLDYFISQFS